MNKKKIAVLLATVIAMTAVTGNGTIGLAAEAGGHLMKIA